ncbi:Transcriptional regulator OS=Streptomyces microflavus OX=1919 GN=Smic_25820 PE=4 SV=1 [Streptomyces microflavus]
MALDWGAAHHKPGSVSGAAPAGRVEGGGEHLAAAERCLDRSQNPADTPVGAFHPGSLALQRAAVGDEPGRPARRRPGRAISPCGTAPPTNAASRATSPSRELAADPTGHRPTWNRRAAHGTSSSTSDPRVDSARADDRVRLLTAKARPHSANPVVTALLGRVREMHRRRPASHGPAT